MKYKYETSTTPLAAFIKARFPADIVLNTKVIVESTGQKRLQFIFESDTIDFKSIENLFADSFANTYNNELNVLRSLVRTLISYSTPKGSELDAND